MFLLVALCLVGTALAAPAIPEETMTPEESRLLMSPYIAYDYPYTGYPAPILPLRTVMIDPKEEIAEPKDWKLEELPEAPELPKFEESKPVLVKLDTSKPLSYFTNWINSFPSFNLPNLPFIGGFFPSSSGRVVVPSYYGYPGYTAPMIVEPAKH
ncbi:uncharacterized protein LOC125225962 [Leguminivora glycinivorella]|uniref:uncharacterized protein LOC125225962 n=1 Tax=Leguminivora glycinivorella TaxID=1035111 RepID=UPI00200D2F10|nr:uncharacterized protein LOC125225962 [Leguminivora glycinivorella]